MCAQSDSTSRFNDDFNAEVYRYHPNGREHAVCAQCTQRTLPQNIFRRTKPSIMCERFNI